MLQRFDYLLALFGLDFGLVFSSFSDVLALIFLVVLK